MSLPPPMPPVRGVEYRVPRPTIGIDLWLDGNEGPAPDPSVQAALSELDPEVLRRYPDSAPLTADIAECFAVDPEQVVVLAGADEALDRFCRAFAGPGRNLVVLCPAFEMTTRYAELAGAQIREVWWTGGEFPLDEVLAAVDADTCAISLATPNNPTGMEIGIDTLVELARRAAGTWLVVDLVYAGFLAADPTAVLLAEPNVLALHSLSKFNGLAGLRVGFAIGPTEAIAPMRRAGGPYSVAGPCLAAARASLQVPASEQYREAVEAERAALTSLLREAAAEVPDSSANFVLATTPRAAWIFAGLASLGIAVRRFPGRPGLSDSLRISCPGRSDAGDRLVTALKTVLQPEAVLFDLDGVLADVSESYRQAIVCAADEFGVAVTAEAITRAKSAGDANNDWVLTWRLITAAGVEASLEAVTEVFESHYQGRLWQKETLLVDKDWLVGLARRCRIGMVTGRPRADAKRFLETFDLVEVFPVVVCMEDGPTKPAPDPVRLALSELGVASAWMLGDTVDDVRAARYAGVVPIGVIAPGEDPGVGEQTLTRAGAARVLTDLNELLELLP